MRVGEKYKVYIETNLGQVLELDTLSVQMDVNGSFYEPVTSELRLKVLGVPNWQSSKVFRENKNDHTENEWKCTWCGRINNRRDEVCKSCSGTRSILY